MNDDITKALALTVETEAVARLLADAIGTMESGHPTLHAAARAVTRLAGLAVEHIAAAIDS